MQTTAPLLIAISLLLALSMPPAALAQQPHDYDAEIARAHALADANRGLRLKSYTYPPYAPPNASAALPPYQTAIAVLWSNTNKAAMAFSGTVLRASIQYYTQHNNSRSYGSSFQCMLARAFALFNSRSR